MSGPRIHEDGPLGSGFSEIQRDNGDFHRTLFDPNSDSRISWDTDKNGDYIGRGHESRNGRVTKEWDR